MKLISSKKSIRRILLSLALSCFFAAFFFIGHKQETRIANHPHSTDAPLLYANQIHDDLTLSFSKAIESAETSVLLVVYTLTDKTIIEALKKKSEEGVEVLVISDAKEAPHVTARLGPLVTVKRRFSEGRMHQKILVVDEKKTWIGSSNMTQDSLRFHGNLVTYIDSPPFSEYVRSKALTMDIQGSVTAFPYAEFTVGGQQIELSFLPEDQKAISRIQKLIRSAKKSIRIAMFTWTRRDLAKSVIDAANRGVDVEVVIDSNQGRGSGATVVALLENSPVKVALSKSGPLLHHKFLYIDKETLLNGSANWTHSAFNKNDECFIILHQLNAGQQRQMDSLWNVIWDESVILKPQLSP